MTTRGFLILHGWQNRRPAGHWEHWLAGELGRLGHQVLYPQLPEPDLPVLEDWLAELRRQSDELRGTERVVVCHSLSCLLWLHAVARDAEEVKVDRVLLVAPPSASVAGGRPEIAAFVPPELAPGLLMAAGAPRLVGSDADPYCPEGIVDEYARPLDAPVDVIEGGAHLNLDAGYGSWPSVLAWCLDPEVRLTPRTA